MVTTSPPGVPVTFNVSGYKIRTSDVPSAQRPWRDRVAPYTDTGVHDAYGVRMFKAADGKLYNHPVGQIQYGLENIAAYRKTGDVFYLNRARMQATRLIYNKQVLRGGWWYPYPFDWAQPQNVHPGIAYEAPWYSGMAQGEALSLFAQLALLPALPAAVQDTYRNAAYRTYLTFQVTNIRDPWHVNADPSKYLWIQEYPINPSVRSDYTFNGMMYAMLGLWDYYYMDHDPNVLRLWDGALTTVDHYFPQLRNPGGYSHYCLTHKVPSPTYHAKHIYLLRQLTNLSGNPRFATYADLLVKDHA